MSDRASGRRILQWLMGWGVRAGVCSLLLLVAGGAVWGAAVPSVSPSRLDFGMQPVGAASAPLDVTLRNSGDLDLRVLDVAVIGSGLQEFLLAGSGGAGGGFTLTPGATRIFRIVFTPLTAGTRSANLAIIHTSPGSPLNVPLTGVGVRPGQTPSLSVSPANLDLGLQAVGTRSPPRALTIANIGDVDARITTIAITGTNGADFEIVDGGGSPVTIPPGDSRVMRIVFAPRAMGPRAAELAITYNAPDSPLRVPLTGSGAEQAPALTATPPDLDFGNQPVGMSSDPRLLTIANAGTDDVRITSVQPVGVNALDFEVADRQLGPLTLRPGERLTIGIIFTPRVPGPRNGELGIFYDALASPLLVPLSGTGDGVTPAPPPAPAARVTPSALNFATQAVGLTSDPRPVTVTNTGTVNLTITGVRLAGAQADEFTLAAGGGGAVIAPRGTHTILVAFTPAAAGRRGASLVITTNAPGSPHTVVLSGSGTQTPTPPVPDSNWPVFMHDPRQLGLAGAVLDPQSLVSWEVSLGSRPGSSPIVLNGTIYVGTEAGGVFAIDAADRSQRWQRPLPAPVRSAPAAGADVVVVSANGLYGLSAADGTVRWQRPDIVGADGVSPMRIGDTIFIGARDPAAATAAVYAVGIATGANVWPEPAPVPAGLAPTATASASLDLGILFVGLGPAETDERATTSRGAVLALRLEDGGAAWSAPAILPAGPPPTGISVGWTGATETSPTPQVALFTAGGQTVTALNAASGELLWVRGLPETALQGPPVVSTPAPEEATLYVGGASGRIFALSSTTGADVPSNLDRPVGAVAGTLALAGTLLFVPTDEALVAVDVETGLVPFSSPLPAASGVAVADGIPYVATSDGRLVGFSR